MVSKPGIIINEGDNIRYARNTKDEIYVYCNGWPGNELIIKKIKPVDGAVISLLGSNEKLSWKANNRRSCNITACLFTR